MTLTQRLARILAAIDGGNPEDPMWTARAERVIREMEWGEEEEDGERDPIGRLTDWPKRYRHLLHAHAELTTAAMKVCNEMDRIHDTKTPPQKYGAPFGAIAELRIHLNKQLGLR